MPKFIRGLIVLALALSLEACVTNIAQEKATRFDQGVAAYDAGDYVHAYQIWSQLAEEDDLAAMRNTATMLRQGKGVAKDDVAAFKLYKEAAEKGLVTAMANVAEMYLAGEGTERDPKAAAGWYARASAAGLSLAQFRLAELYRQGIGVERDPAKERALLERAARNGYEPAQARLREMGIAIEPVREPQTANAAGDPWRHGGQHGEEGTRREARPPEQRGPRPHPGDPFSADALASLNSDDTNVMRQGLAAYHSGNKAQAYRAWRQVADKGVAEAQTRVALLYERGEGVKEDAIEAYRWLRLAAAQSNPGAWAELPVVAAQLSPAERALGESLVRTPNGAQTKGP